jgi:hypothetical protein
MCHRGSPLRRAPFDPPTLITSANEAKSTAMNPPPLPSQRAKKRGGGAKTEWQSKENQDEYQRSERTAA